MVNGRAVRPSREVHSGDRIAIVDPLRGRQRELELLELPSGQVSRRDSGDFYRIMPSEQIGELEGG